jgi:hypothetical protein
VDRLKKTVVTIGDGAVSDGVSDNSKTIQAALNAAARVYVPCGRFAVSTGLKIPSKYGIFWPSTVLETVATGETAHKYAILSNSSYGGAGNRGMHVHDLFRHVGF